MSTLSRRRNCSSFARSRLSDSQLLYGSLCERVQDALDAAFETGLVASNTPTIEDKANQMQTGA